MKGIRKHSRKLMATAPRLTRAFDREFAGYIAFHSHRTITAPNLTPTFTYRQPLRVGGQPAEYVHGYITGDCIRVRFADGTERDVPVADVETIQ